MQRIALTFLAPVVLGACAGGPNVASGPSYGSEYRQAPPPISVGPAGATPSPLARSASYSCEDLTTVILTEGQPTAQVTLNSGLVLSLGRRPDPIGQSYGAPPYEFHARGQDGTFFNDRRPVRCRTK